MKYSWISHLAMLSFSPKGSMEIQIRPAATSDLPAITDLTIEAASQIPGFRYKYPLSKEYPKDTYHYTWLEYENYIKDTDNEWKWDVMVAEINSEDGQSMEVIAVAVWEVSVLGGQPSTAQEPLVSGHDWNTNKLESHSTSSIQTRRDENPAHVKAWKETLDNARREYLEPNGPVNGPLSYLHLQQLHTHPDYQYNGAGTALTKWGIDLATKHQLKIGLFASPMGEELFRELHFIKLARVVVEVKGETSRVIVSCMALMAPEKK